MRLLIVLALISVACAVQSQSTRIVGGIATTTEDYPFMANILFNSPTGFIQHCGGTLVTSTSVVSAAHCFYEEPSSMFRVRLGSTLASSGGNVHTISRIIIHEQYNPEILINDIVVVKLTSPAVFSNHIKIARIAGPKYILSENTLVHAIGWGDTEYDGNASEILQHVGVNVINHQICTERYALFKLLPPIIPIPQVTPEMLCTGILNVGGKDACQGDSGGPIIHNKDVLVGITSWGYKCAHPFFPGVSVRVSSYTDWIYTNSVN